MDIKAEKFGDLTSQEVGARLKSGGLVLPIGAVEQHGPRLPLTVDIDIATALGGETARRAGFLLAPAVHYGARSLPHCGGGADFAGTIFVRGGVFTEYLIGVFESYVLAGARSLIVLNGHYENEAFVFEALDSCRTAGFLQGVEVLAFSWWSLVEPEFLRQLFGDTFPGWHAEHAGVCETSLMLYLRPDAVRQPAFDHDSPPMSGVYVHPVDSSRISHGGALSGTRGASAEIGRVLFDHVCDHIEVLVKEPPGMLRPAHPATGTDGRP